MSTKRKGVLRNLNDYEEEGWLQDIPTINTDNVIELTSKFVFELRVDDLLCAGFVVHQLGRNVKCYRQKERKSWLQNSGSFIIEACKTDLKFLVRCVQLFSSDTAGANHAH